MKKIRNKIIGYTSGVFDLFHIGHLNILKNAKSKCDFLIVGVTIDELVSYKKKSSVIAFEERIEIVKSIKYVDKVVPQRNIDKFDAWEKYKFNKIFVGSDWEGTDEWKKYEHSLSKHGVVFEYFPYTEGTSSTLIRELLFKLNGKK